MKKQSIFILMLIMICMWGGFYEFTAAVYCVVFLILLLIIYRKQKKIHVQLNITTFGIGIIFICNLISVLLATDKGTALLGIFKILTAVLFWLLWNNLSKNRQEEILLTIPQVGTVVTCLAVAGYFIPGMKEWFYRADRLGGVFQYSNTYAMFLLVGIIVLLYKNPHRFLENIETAVLVIGVIFTGSRSIFVIMIFTLLCLTVKDLAVKRSDKKRLHKIPEILGVAAVVAGIVILGQNLLKLDIKRLWKLTLDSSTLNGRLLYWQDAIPVILKHPFGLGYMGYFFRQPQFQTGCYTTKFVHNDILQCALDAGILAMAVLLVIVFANIFTQKNTELKRILLALLFIHALFDFDLQFSAMVCIAIMCCASPSTCKVKDIQGKTEGKILAIMCGICIYFGAALGFEYMGQYELSLQMYPYNTFARLNLMQEKGRREDAEKVIERNGMIASAYEAAVQSTISNGDYKATLFYAKEMMRCAGYDIFYYNQAVYYMSFALDQAVRGEDDETAQEILEELKSVEQRLEELRQKTSVLAYRIVDKPEFELEPEIQEYLNKMSEISL